MVRAYLFRESVAKISFHEITFTAYLCKQSAPFPELLWISWWITSG